MFTLFAKSTRAERVSDTVFFKHKCLTQPTVLPEDTIVAAAQQLTEALKGNAKDHEELEALTKVADLFESIAKDNGIQQYVDESPRAENSESPRVESSESPRVENSPSPRVPKRLIVAYPPVVVASDKDPKHPMPPLPNYISQEEPEEPTFQRRSFALF